MRHETGPRRPPAFLLAMTILAIASLGLGVINQFGQQNLQAQRNDDRIASDLSACERGNTFRQQVIDLGNAMDHMTNEILDTVFGGATRPAVIELRRKLDKPIAEYRKAVAAIEIVDCDKAVPGAKEKP